MIFNKNKQRNNKLKIIHVGLPGIPFDKSAAVNRCLTIYSLFDDEFFDLFVINNRALGLKKDELTISRKGKYSNISYQYTPPYIYKPNKFIKRRYNNFMGRLNEFILILKMGIKRKIDIMFFYPTGRFLELILYKFFSILFGFPIICHYVEFRSAFESRKGIRFKINDILFDRYLHLFIDGLIPISYFLSDRIKERSRYLPLLRIPPIIDFKLFTNLRRKDTTPFFLYVGRTGYKKSIELILESFKLVKDNNFYLYLVLSGSLNNINDLIKEHPKYKMIRIFTNLEYADLIQMNKDARALLIPLSDSIQDQARFPQKICEYSASANPIITTNYGEIRNFFQDGVNALVANKNIPNQFAKKMNFIINRPKESERIGRNSFKTGLKYFNSNSYKEELLEFIYKQVKR